MTFILGLAILAVFCIGYFKLLWTNRLIKRQEVEDEEKRVRIEELRSSGQIIESTKSHEIPFGVRAIQSGIQVDGIWISNTSTPAPSELKLEHIQGHPAGTESTVSAPDSGEHSQQTTRSPSRQGRTPLRTSDSANLYLAVDDAVESNANRHSYKPRKSSHLRYGSYGETRYDEETLGQLEGDVTPKKKVYTHRPRGSRHLDMEADSSSAADNEQSSESTSDSDGTLSSNMVLSGDKPRKTSSNSPHIVGERASVVASMPTGRVLRESLPLQSSKVDYFSVPTISPKNETSDPFLTPNGSITPLASPPARQEEFDSSLFQNAGLTGGSSRGESSQTRYAPLVQSPEPFVPGELHVNKSVRKVNSGFEVLPAGTFGVPTELRSNDMDYENDSGERRQSKLQKKGRNSMTGRRASGAMDRP